MAAQGGGGERGCVAGKRWDRVSGGLMHCCRLRDGLTRERGTRVYDGGAIGEGWMGQEDRKAAMPGTSVATGRRSDRRAVAGEVRVVLAEE